MDIDERIDRLTNERSMLRQELEHARKEWDNAKAVVVQHLHHDQFCYREDESHKSIEDMMYKTALKHEAKTRYLTLLERIDNITAQITTAELAKQRW